MRVLGRGGAIAASFVILSSPPVLQPDDRTVGVSLEMPFALESTADGVESAVGGHFANAAEASICEGVLPARGGQEVDFVVSAERVTAIEVNRRRARESFPGRAASEPRSLERESDSSAATGSTVEEFLERLVKLG